MSKGTDSHHKKHAMAGLTSQLRAVRAVTSNQTDEYDRLETLVCRYANTTYLRPIAAHTEKAFFEANEFVQKRACPVILDSGCGTGQSTLHLAARFPDYTIIAVDKSEARLSRNKNNKNASTTINHSLPENILFVRGELLDFWRLIQKENWNIQKHALYYPNPWPKSSEAVRRFHLHPIFPTLLSLSPETELRTNWEIYAKEFTHAATYLSSIQNFPRNIQCEPYLAEIPETAFERKYRDAGQTLWRVLIQNQTITE